MLANTSVVPVGSTVLSLGGLLFGLVAAVVASWLARRGDESESLTLGF